MLGFGGNIFCPIIMNHFFYFYCIRKMPVKGIKFLKISDVTKIDPFCDFAVLIAWQVMSENFFIKDSFSITIRRKTHGFPLSITYPPSQSFCCYAIKPAKRAWGIFFLKFCFFPLELFQTATDVSSPTPSQVIIRQSWKPEV